ncbi:MAG: hypothetical protein AB1716_06730 [Planctomycetota bacterium]
MRAVLAETRDTAEALADPRLWTRRYPLPAVGVAFALGFLLAPTGRKREAAREPVAADGEPQRHRRRGLRGAAADRVQVLLGGGVGALVTRLASSHARDYLVGLMEQYARPEPMPEEPVEQSAQVGAGI